MIDYSRVAITEVCYDDAELYTVSPLPEGRLVVTADDMDRGTLHTLVHAKGGETVLGLPPGRYTGIHIGGFAVLLDYRERCWETEYRLTVAGSPNPLGGRLLPV